MNYEIDKKSLTSEQRVWLDNLNTGLLAELQRSVNVNGRATLSLTPAMTVTARKAGAAFLTLESNASFSVSGSLAVASDAQRWLEERAEAAKQLETLADDGDRYAQYLTGILYRDGGLLIPCIAGIFMFAEKMKLMQLAGIALLIFSGWLLIGYSKKQTGAFTFKTLLLLIGSMLSNGTIMLSQKMFSKYLPDMSASVFSFYTFSLLGAGMLAGLIINSFSKANRTEIKTVPRKLFLYGTILSVILFAINQLATVAAKNVPSAVMFPINDGGATIISALTGACFFKEKLTKRSAAGILLGITSLIIINFG